MSNPVDVLLVGANESGHYANTRLPMIRNLIEQRAASGSAFALLSSGVEIFQHQVDAAMTVISDPVQRYLLADEVGLGKTIEAGFVIRQVLLDAPAGRVTIVAPDVLRRQWQQELRSKFFIDDFPDAKVKITSHETPASWTAYQGSDLLVVDEAHNLVQVAEPTETPYRELTELAHSSQRVLLLSATPLTSRLSTHLGLLHLLEPHLYRWSDRQAFEQKFRLRKQLANAVYGLDADYEALLPSAISEIDSLIPDDPRFRELSEQALAFLTEDGDLRSEDDRASLALRVESLRAHISETYRLHRRMIRHRRRQVTELVSDGEALPRYELTGRIRPQALLLDTPRQHLMQESLLEWQAEIANWLLDEAREDEAAAYGHVLGILVSRANTLSDDFKDVLRWRLGEDSAAAGRAGLSAEERNHLRSPAIAPFEHEILSQFHESPGDNEATELINALSLTLKSHHHVVVFCGAGAMAGQLARALAGDTRLRVAEHTWQAGAAAGDAAVAEWRAHGGVLIADDSAEDGLNLQIADAVVHCRLPASPNRLEQRIGRVDRYRGDVPDRSARQFVLRAPNGRYTLPGSWLALLDEGFDIFGQSVSALQDTIDQDLPEIWATAVRLGPEGLTGLVGQVSRQLARERREIDGMDMLEAIHNARTGAVDIAAAIGDLEARWRDIEDATVGLAGEGPGGLRFQHPHVGAGGKLIQFARGSRSPLVPPRVLARGGTHLTQEMMLGTFNRTAALRRPGTRVFRSGNPFVDMLARTVWIEDRGQATAYLRSDPRAGGQAHVYFGFDFLVEAAIGATLDLVGTDSASENVLRRQADCLLPPFMRRIWMPAGSRTAVDDQGQIAWLDRPYRPSAENGPDVNLSQDRIGPLLEVFGGRERFSSAIWFAEGCARTELARSTGLRQRCEEARQRGTASLAIRQVQARARQAAGRIVTDTESYAMDVRISDSLVAGLAQPKITVISVVCLVRGALPGLRHG